jgi:hypothetical protein
MREGLTWIGVAAVLVVACGGRDDLASAASSSPENVGVDVGSVGVPPPNDDAAPFAACSADTDCSAVPKVGCCHLGWKVAVNKDKAKAYAASYHCPIAEPICIQILVIDNRTPRCDPGAHQCKLVDEANNDCGAEECM